MGALPVFPTYAQLVGELANASATLRKLASTVWAGSPGVGKAIELLLKTAAWG